MHHTSATPHHEKVIPMSASRSSVRNAAIVLGTALLLLLTLIPAGADAQDDEPVEVVASFSVIADIVQQVGGDRVHVTSLVPVGGDAHTFDPSPDQVAAIADADLIVEAGHDYEPWLPDLVESSGTDAPVLALFESEQGGSPTATETTGDGHEHGDEIHAWLNVQNTIDGIPTLVDALTGVAPDRADAWAKGGEAYTAELQDLDTYIRDQTATLSEDRRQLVTAHESFGAFADAYGYEIPGVLLESRSTEGADAPARHVAELTQLIEERDIPAVFPDAPGSADMLQPLADEAGVDIAPQLYVETIGDTDSGAESYIDMMRYNIDTIVTALGA
jgi:ABC-type Zn uptake system ZnuABC Zn-binding protein ZnuA